MKSPATHIRLLALAGLAGVALAGCSKKEEPAQPRASESTPRIDAPAAPGSTTLDNAKDAMADTWDNVKDFAYDQRTNFVAGVRNMAMRFDHQLDSWTADAPERKADQKDAWNKAVAEYRSARANLDTQLTNLGNATSETWDNAKENVSKAWSDVSRAFHDLQSKKGT
jgi:hypothetical protein